MANQGLKKVGTYYTLKLTKHERLLSFGRMRILKNNP